MRSGLTSIPVSLLSIFFCHRDECGFCMYLVCECAEIINGEMKFRVSKAECIETVVKMTGCEIGNDIEMRKLDWNS